MCCRTFALDPPFGLGPRRDNRKHHIGLKIIVQFSQWGDRLPIWVGLSVRLILAARTTICPGTTQTSARIREIHIENNFNPDQLSITTFFDNANGHPRIHMDLPFFQWAID